MSTKDRKSRSSGKATSDQSRRIKIVLKDGREVDIDDVKFSVPQSSNEIAAKSVSNFVGFRSSRAKIDIDVPEGAKHRPGGAINFSKNTSISTMRPTVANLETAFRHVLRNVTMSNDREVRIRILLNIFDQYIKQDGEVSQEAFVDLPEKAPSNYSERPDKREKASDFLARTYARELSAGIIFQNDVKRLDPQLKTALDNEFRGRRNELRKLLPTKQDEVSARLQRTLGPVRPEARPKAVRALSLLKAAKATS